MLIDKIQVTVENGSLPEEEIRYYIRKIKRYAKGKKLRQVNFRLADEYMDLRYSFESFPLERIRRVATPADWQLQVHTG